jgi:hypothetical protein
MQGEFHAQLLSGCKRILTMQTSQRKPTTERLFPRWHRREGSERIQQVRCGGCPKSAAATCVCVFEVEVMGSKR